MSNAPVVFYTSSFCPYCMMAKRLLDSKNIEYTAINVDRDMEKRREMEQLSGRTSVPQIFIAGQSMGGYDDIAALDSVGELDPLLASS